VRSVPEELLDIYAACQFIGGSRPINPATLWRGVKAGRYSKPIRIGPQSVRWRRAELAADIELAAERDVVSFSAERFLQEIASAPSKRAAETVIDAHHDQLAALPPDTKADLLCRAADLIAELRETDG
jgi:predicted DNA-binding transcriptional regulator AlpA